MSRFSHILIATLSLRSHYRLIRPIFLSFHLNRYEFIIVAIQTLDIFGSQAIKLIHPVDSMAAQLHAETRKTALLF